MFFNFPRDFRELKLAPGCTAHVAWGQHIMFSLFILQPNSEMSLHSHHNEQMGIILEGEIEVTIGNETKLMKKGDVYLIPSDIPHGGRTHIESVMILDAFSPPREEYKIISTEEDEDY